MLVLNPGTSQQKSQAAPTRLLNRTPIREEVATYREEIIARIRNNHRLRERGPQASQKLDRTQELVKRERLQIFLYIQTTTLTIKGRIMFLFKDLP